MHLWAPDAIQGAPTPVSGFISMAPRMAGIAVAIRVLTVVFSQPDGQQGSWKILGTLDWTSIVGLVAGVTMMLGSLLALRQESAKRLLGYLIVSESGFLLTGLLVQDQVGLAAILYAVLVQLFALMGTFYILSYLHERLGSDQLASFRGVMARHVPECVALVIFLVSLVGIPPLPGFIAKFALLGAVVRHGWHFLAVVCVLASALSTAAIARLLYSLLGESSSRGERVIAPHEFSLQGHRALLAAFIFPIVMI
jgi:NADH-quinone oxidoreductase subunit N